MNLEFVCTHPKFIPISEESDFYKTLMNWQKNTFNANCVFAHLDKCSVHRIMTKSCYSTGNCQ